MSDFPVGPTVSLVAAYLARKVRKRVATFVHIRYGNCCLPDGNTDSSLGSTNRHGSNADSAGEQLIGNSQEP